MLGKPQHSALAKGRAIALYVILLCMQPIFRVEPDRLAFAILVSVSPSQGKLEDESGSEHRLNMQPASRTDLALGPPVIASTSLRPIEPLLVRNKAMSEYKEA